MLNAGLFASSSSLVVVPDLSGLTAAQALTALTNAELIVGTVTTTGSGANDINNNTIASQGTSAGSLVERYSLVAYSLYAYSPSPPPPGPTGQYYCRTRSFSPNVTSGIFTSSTDVSGYGCNPDGTPDYSTACVYSTTSADPGTPSQPICSTPVNHDVEIDIA